MALEPMNFEDLEPLQIRVTLPKGVKCILREASADAEVKYKLAAVKGITVNDGKASREDNSGIFDSEPVLVSRCLYYANDWELKLDSFGNPDQTNLVPLSVILALPTKVFKKLQAAVHEMSPSLKEGNIEVPKEQPNGTPPTSA